MLTQSILDFLSVFEPIGAWILRFWALWAFLILFPFLAQLWLAYRQLIYKRSEARSVLLEVVIPRELHKNPQAMEQVLYSIHSIRNSAANAKEKWWDGEVTLWFTFEIVSLGGELHFFMRIPKKHRNMVEAAFYAQYPDVEILEAHQDFTNRFPAKTISELQEKGYEFFGNELVLQQDDTYPIRTYMEFIENPQEESRVDPVAAVLETMRKIKPAETIGVQVLVRPLVDDRWRKKGLKVIEKLKEKLGRRQMFSPAFGEFIMIDRTPGETELLKMLDHKIGKPAFEAILRYIYISPREIYSDGFARRGVLSAFNQYASESRNRFRHNIRVWTRTQLWFKPFIFPSRRGQTRKIQLYRNYREARMDEETFVGNVLDASLFYWGLFLDEFFSKDPRYHWLIGVRQRNDMVLNTEEVATIYHLPTEIVLTGPLIRRVESRRVGPPAGLPIFGEEGEELPVTR